MKGLLQQFIWVVFGLFFAGAAAEESIPKCDPIVSGEVAGYAVFSNPGPSDILDARAQATLVPDVYTPGSAKMLAGRLLVGDPAIFKSAGDKPLVMLFFAPVNKDTAVVFAELQRAFFVASDDSKIETELREAGLRTEIVDGVVVAAATTESVARGKAALAQYKNVLQAAPKSGVRVAFNLAALFEGREPGNTRRLEALVNRKNPLADQPVFQRAGLTAPDFIASTLAMHSFSDGFFSQSAVFQADADLSADGLRFDVRFEAKKDTVLESFLAAPSAARPGKLGPLGAMGVGAIRVFGNPRAQNTAWEKLRNAIAADPRLVEVANSAFFSAWLDNSMAWGGEMFISLGGKDYMPYSLSSVADVERHQAAASNMLAPLKAGSFVAKMMSAFNFLLDAKFSPAGRTRNSVPVGVSSIEVDLSKVNRQQFPKFANVPAVNKFSFETAIEKDVSITSLSPTTLDKAIDRIYSSGVKPGKPLQSEDVFGAQQSIYLDIDLPQLALAGMGSGASAESKTKVGTNLWITALGFESGRARLQSKLPFAPVEEYLRSIGPLIPDLLKTINRSKVQKPQGPVKEETR